MRGRFTTVASGVALVVAATFARPAVNQAQGSDQSPRPVVVEQAVRFAVSQAVRDLPAEKATEIRPDQDRPRLRIIPNREVLRDGRSVDEDLLVQMTAPEPNMPGVLVSFEGLNNTDNFNVYGGRVNPPDTNGDVGPNHYVQQVNLLVRIYNKAGAPLTPPFRMSSLFASLPGSICSTNDNGDPVVIYDPLADRWILSQFAFFSISSPPYHECIAISQTGDPTGAYFLYDFETPGDNFPDYPKLGVWPDAYYMTTVQFLFGGSFNGAGAFAFERSKMLVGDATASLIYFDLNLADFPEGRGPLLPGDLDGVSAPPGGAPNVQAYFTANEFGDPADALRLFNFHADFAVPANSTYLERAGSPLPVAAFNPISPPGRADIPQPPPGFNVDSITDRVLHRLQYRNRGGFESLVTNHTVDADPGGGFLAGVRYYELRNPAPGGIYAVNEQATFAPDAINRWMGSAAVDHQGNLAVGYSVTNAVTFPSIRYAGRLATDPPNGLFQGEATLIAGTGVQTSTNSRWGDYSMLAVDPVDDCTFWYTTEYYTAASQLTSPAGWLTRVGSFKYTQCSPRPTGTLIVTVTECDGGNPVNKALIKLNSSLWGSTNASGVFTAKLDPGAYNIVAEKTGLGSGSTSANVSAGSTTNASVCLTGTVDLRVSALAAKAKAAAGATIPVTYTIANSGSSTSVATTTKVYLSTDPNFSAGDVEIGSDGTVPVPPGGTKTDVANSTIPGNTTAGVYYLIARADATNVQSETDEGNNTRSKKIKIGPNLVITALTVTPNSAPPGGSVTIKDTTKNSGAQGTGVPTVTRWYLSVDKIVGPGDNLLGTHNVPALAPGASHSLTMSVTIPGGKPPGAYFIIASADDGTAVAEVKETDNTLAKPFTIF
jgi:CARDB protein